jgi:antirestriction protein ArdC
MRTYPTQEELLTRRVEAVNKVNGYAKKLQDQFLDLLKDYQGKKIVRKSGGWPSLIAKLNKPEAEEGFRDGLEYPKEEIPTREFNTIEECERIVSGMPKAPVLTHEEQRAYYQRNADRVNMPKKDTFDTAENYYATLFHELTHATGHESRLGRMQEKFSHFGDTTYAKEELIAEMGASFLCNVAGIMDRTIDNSASYINSWLKALKNDRKLVVSASSKAQEAAEFILGKTKED